MTHMEFFPYVLVSFVTFLGLVLGMILVKVAPEEQKPGRKFFIFSKMALFFLIIAFFLFYNSVNFIFSIASLTFLLVIMLAKRLQLDKSSLVYFLFGTILFYSSKYIELFILEAILIFLYGIPNSSLVVNVKKGNYLEILARKIWFFLPIVLLYIIF
jgi:hypothetical protein